MSSTTLFYGAVVHSLDLDHIEYLLHACVCVQDGAIAWIEKDVQAEELQDVAATHGLQLDDAEVIELPAGQFLVPGLVDTHTHAPQYPNLGLGGNYQLLDWLDNLTFPREGMFGDVGYAREVYDEVVRRNLSVGTTTCCYYGSSHWESTGVLAEILNTSGQRGLVGKCNMDRDSKSCTESSAQQSLAETKKLVDHIRALTPADSGHLPLVQPCLTPRFAISCSDELLQGLGEMAKADPTIAIQTHIAENSSEIDSALKLFPDCKDYASVYAKFGLLRQGTILAHAVYLEQSEIDLIAITGTGISHCPTSNCNLRSGGARVKAMIEAGIKVGLGSDCSGGYAIGVLAQLRHASDLSKLLSLHEKNPSMALSVPQLFHMATLGGASLCRLDQSIGNFQTGKEFDALHIKVGQSPNFFLSDIGARGKREWSMDKLKEVFEKWLFVSDDRDIQNVFVRGKKVAGSSA